MSEPFELPPQGFLGRHALADKTLRAEVRDAAVRFGVALPVAALGLVDGVRVALSQMTYQVVPHAGDEQPFTVDELDTVRRLIEDYAGDPLLARLCREVSAAVTTPRELEGARQFFSLVAEVLAGRKALEQPQRTSFATAARELAVKWPSSDDEE